VGLSRGGHYLLDARRSRSRIERRELSFERFAEDLAEGLAEGPTSAGENDAEQALLLEEVKIGCTHGLLVCLDRPHRLAYILGEILEMESPQAAGVLGITPAAFRQRLARSRRVIVDFTRAHCGLVEPERPCRCRRRVARAVALGRVDPARLLFARDPLRARRFPEVLAEIRRLDEARRAAALYRSHPEPPCPEDLAANLRRLLLESS
jgi:hypothetical protein